ncbi:MAG: hypothetical protein GY835_25390 [bacterium]|nr:hypothetical protein [bacterium]
MKKITMFLLLAILALGMILLPGCGDKTETADETTADTKLAAHDCDGGCGMTDVPMERLSEVDGKYYCAGCKVKMDREDEAETESH